MRFNKVLKKVKVFIIIKTFIYFIEAFMIILNLIPIFQLHSSLKQTNHYEFIRKEANEYPNDGISA